MFVAFKYFKQNKSIYLLLLLKLLLKLHIITNKQNINLFQLYISMYLFNVFKEKFNYILLNVCIWK